MQQFQLSLFVYHTRFTAGLDAYHYIHSVMKAKKDSNRLLSSEKHQSLEMPPQQCMQPITLFLFFFDDLVFRRTRNYADAIMRPHDVCIITR